MQSKTHQSFILTGRWHLFCTIRSQKRSTQIEYLSFADFRDANKAERHVLKLTDEDFAAPQIFYFSPHAKWYLIYQVIDSARKPTLQPAYSTTKDIADPASWTKPTLLFSAQPVNLKIWIDFWVICDDSLCTPLFYNLGWSNVAELKRNFRTFQTAGTGRS